MNANTSVSLTVEVNSTSPWPAQWIRAAPSLREVNGSNDTHQPENHIQEESRAVEMIDDIQDESQGGVGWRTAFDEDDQKKFLFARGDRAFRLLAAAIHDLGLDTATEANLATIANEARECLVDATFVDGMDTDDGQLMIDNRPENNPGIWARYSDGRPVVSILELGDAWATMADHPEPLRWSAEGYRGYTTDFRPLDAELGFQDWLNMFGEPGLGAASWTEMPHESQC
jgi:hypothetical protein